MHFISLSLIISVHINGENTSWLQFKILVLARDNNSCSFLWGLSHTAESIRAKNARPNSVAANVKLYFTACGKCSMCEQQKYCLISLVLTNLGWAPRKKHNPVSLKSINFCTYFQIHFLNFFPVNYDRNICVQREKENCKDSFRRLKQNPNIRKKYKKKNKLFASLNILKLKIICTHSAKTQLSIFNMILIKHNFEKVRTYIKRLICTF